MASTALPALRTSPEYAIVRPTAVTVSRSPLTTIDAGSFVTVTLTESPIDPDVARTQVVPTPRAVISPTLETVASDELSDLHVTAVRGSASPRAFLMVIAGVAVSSR